MAELNSAHGDPCPVELCATHVQGRPDAPRDRVAGLLLHLQVVHYPNLDLDELRSRLPELYAAHQLRFGGDAR